MYVTILQSTIKLYRVRNNDTTYRKYVYLLYNTTIVHIKI